MVAKPVRIVFAVIAVPGSSVPCVYLAWCAEYVQALLILAKGKHVLYVKVILFFCKVYDIVYVEQTKTIKHIF